MFDRTMWNKSISIMLLALFSFFFVNALLNAPATNKSKWRSE